MGDLGAGRKHLWGQQSATQAVALQEAAGGWARTQEQQQVPAREPGVISMAYVDMLSISRVGLKSFLRNESDLKK